MNFVKKINGTKNFSTVLIYRFFSKVFINGLINIITISIIIACTIHIGNLVTKYELKVAPYVDDNMAVFNIMFATNWKISHIKSVMKYNFGFDL